MSKFYNATVAMKAAFQGMTPTLKSVSEKYILPHKLAATAFPYMCLAPTDKQLTDAPRVGSAITGHADKWGMEWEWDVFALDDGSGYQTLEQIFKGCAAAVQANRTLGGNAISARVIRARTAVDPDTSNAVQDLPYVMGRVVVEGYFAVDPSDWNT